MKRLIGLLTSAATTLVAATTSGVASATPRYSVEGIEFGFRTGYTLPLGNETSSTYLNGTYDGVVPLWFDLGWRFGRQFYLGAAFHYGIGIPNTGNANLCLPGLSCSGNTIGAEIEAIYHFTERGRFDPWIGLGVGYEWMSYSIEGVAPGTSIESKGTLSNAGPEFGNLQAGLDYIPMRGLELGPFVSYSVGEYLTTSGGTTIQDLLSDVPFPSRSISGKGIHEWLTFGLRGTFDLRIQ